MNTPLAGKRILVTRARHQAGDLAEALAAQGATALLLPTIAIAPPSSYAALDAALAAIESFDWLILTSANAAEALGARLRDLNPARLARIRVAAVGPATARAAREIGLRLELIPREYVAEAVVEALRDQVRGQRVLLARAEAARDLIPEELGRLGAEVHLAPAYRTILPAESVEQIQTLFAPGAAPPDAVTFTSSSTVKNFFALLAAAKVERPPAWPAVSIGPITTRTLRDCNWAPVFEASEASIPGLVEAYARIFGPGARP